MEGLGIFVFIAYLVFALIGRAVRERGGASQEAAQARARAAARARAERLARAGVTRPAEGRDHGTSATQVEARQLEELLRGLGGLVERPEGPVAVEEPEHDGPEEAYSLEGTSLEGESWDPARARDDRPEVSEDDSAATLVQARIDAAALRSGALGPADHVAFHRKLAVAEPAKLIRLEARRPAGDLTLAELRRAVVWREILGPPVALVERHPGRGD